MKLANKNQAVVQLAMYARTPAGAIKTNVASGTVRVYQVAADGTETDILSAQALSEKAGKAGHWEYIWQPASLPTGQYMVEFYAVDDDTIQMRAGEQLVVLDIATQTDLELVRKHSVGRWRITANQLLVYDDDGTTVLARFNLFDADGNPAVTNVRERVPV
jgi:hypothetical protein